MKISDCIPSFVKTYYSQLQAPIDYKKIFKTAVEYSPTPSLSPRSFKMIVGGLSISIAIICAIYKFIIGGASKPENKNLALEIVSEIKSLRSKMKQLRVKTELELTSNHLDKDLELKIKTLGSEFQTLWSKTEQLDPEFQKLLSEAKKLGSEIEWLGKLEELGLRFNLEQTNRELKLENKTLKQELLKSKSETPKSSNQLPKDSSRLTNDQLEKAFNQFFENLDDLDPESNPLLLALNGWLQKNAPLKNNDFIASFSTSLKSLFSTFLMTLKTYGVDPAATIELLSKEELKEEMDPHQEAKPLQTPSNNQEAFTEEHPREETESQHQ